MEKQKVKHTFKKYTIPVTDERIKRYAEIYIKLRSDITIPTDLENSPLLQGLDFSIDKIRDIFRDYQIPKRPSLNPMNDIYRSDLGELLMVHFFEEGIKKITENSEAFIIPIKNISDREVSYLPGRGLDAIGYKEQDGKVSLLLGEAKVSESQEHPPSVVDKNKDSIYKTHKKHLNDKDYLLNKLTSYAKRLRNKDAVILDVAILAIKTDIKDKYDIVYGCCLVRDETCVDEEKDYGKMKENMEEFDIGQIYFIIPSFDKPIKETVNKFYEHVQLLSNIQKADK